MAVQTEINGHVAVVTMERREALNAFNTAQLNSLLENLHEVERQASVRVGILTGAGDRSFAAGADIKEMSTKSPSEAVTFAKLGHSVANMLEQSRIPWIAAVNGYAFGGGCEMALACDMRFASDNAVFAQPEVGLGIPPGWGATQRLSRIVGPGIAAEMILSGRWIKADEALSAGLINAVYAHSDLMPNVMELAATIAGNSPMAVQAAKRLMRVGRDAPQAVGLEHESQAFALLFGSADQKEGMSAFLEKRDAVFSDPSDNS
ncbi:MAG: enoyl-CoA hydratase-related protein [Thermomicrobiales bacterium]